MNHYLYIIIVLIFSCISNICNAEISYSKELENKANGGDAQAQSHLAWCYGQGSGVDVDHDKEFYWASKAANSGYPYGMYYLGMCYHNGKGTTKDAYEAVKWFEKAYAMNSQESAKEMLEKYFLPEAEFEYKLIKYAEEGDDEAQEILATFLRNPKTISGKYTVFDNEKGLEFLKQSAAKGNASALCSLAQILMQGTPDVEKNTAEGVKYLQMSAEKGYYQAQYSYAFCFAYGQGTKQDYDQAVAWFTKAADNGCAEAMYELGNSYFKCALGLPQDYGKAVEWYKKGAQANSSNSFVNLGYCYEKGLGVEKDFWKAVECYSQAMLLGNQTGYDNIVALSNEIVKKYPKHFKDLIKKAEQGDYQSQGQLAVIYMSELPQMYNLDNAPYDDKAVKWLVEAVENGCAELYYLAADMYETGALPSLATKDGRTIDIKDSKQVITPNLSKAAKYYNLSVASTASNRTLSLLKMAHAYYDGSSLVESVDYNLAAWHLKEAIKDLEKLSPSSELKEAYALMSKCYRFGRGVDQNEEKADLYLKKSIRLGDTDGLKVVNALAITD